MADATPPDLSRRAPSVFVSVKDTSATVTVTPPAGYSAADYDFFELVVCNTGTCMPSIRCAASDAAACIVTGLHPAQTYDVTAAAVKGRTTGPTGPPATFTTLYT